MTEDPTSKPRGRGRVAFIGLLDSIRLDLAAGYFLIDIHAKNEEALGITYSAFRKLVSRYASEARLQPSRPTLPKQTP